MRSPKHPPAPLAQLRDKHADDATQLLADAVRARQEAEQAEATTALRAEDLVQASRSSVRVRAEKAQLEERLAAAIDETQAARAREPMAPDGLARVDESGSDVLRGKRA